MTITPAPQSDTPLHTLYRQDADLYEAAFTWDLTDQVDWLLGRLGDVRTILEPFCGGGRTFAALARRDVRVVGIDRAPEMVRRARAAQESLGHPPTILEADTADFDLSPITTEPLDGAICPINSFSYLGSEALAASHLDAVARHLRPGATYLIQLDIIARDPGAPPTEPVDWETERDGLRVRTSWRGVSFDHETRIEDQISRIEVLGGPDAGRATTDEHAMLMWDWGRWLDLIDRSPFEHANSYDDNAPGRPALRPTPDSPRIGSAWHELVLRG